VRRSGSNRFKASAVGLATAVLLQSSTAVAVLAAGFAASGTLAVSQGIALLLGADLGSALVVQLLSLDISWLMPLLLLVGGTLFMKGQTGFVKQIGRILLGIGLILLSLRLMGEATVPLKDSDFLSVTMSYLEQDYIAAFLVGALVTWLFHSSVASVLLVSTLVAQGVVPLAVGFALVLGCNLGAGLIAWGLTRSIESRGRRVPVGNVLFRGIAAVAVLVALRFVSLPVAPTAIEAAQWIVYAHVAFNALLLVVCLPFIGLMTRITDRLIPGPEEHGRRIDPLSDRQTALDRSILQVPQLSLASATRECLRMSDLIEVMLKPVMSFYESGDKAHIKEVRAMDSQVNRLHSDIKLYLAELAEESLSDRDRLRKLELINFAINMEAAGDVICKNLTDLALRKNRDGLTFSPQGWSELKELHSQVTANMHLALNVLVSGDLNSARQLIEEKGRIRDQERHSNVQHLRRLQTGTVKSIETSDIHLETLRALRQINSLFAAVAYPILNECGELLPPCADGHKS